MRGQTRSLQTARGHHALYTARYSTSALFYFFFFLLSFSRTNPGPRLLPGAAAPAHTEQRQIHRGRLICASAEVEGSRGSPPPQRPALPLSAAENKGCRNRRSANERHVSGCFRWTSESPQGERRLLGSRSGSVGGWVTASPATSLSRCRDHQPRRNDSSLPVLRRGRRGS